MGGLSLKLHVLAASRFSPRPVSQKPKQNSNYMTKLDAKNCFWINYIGHSNMTCIFNIITIMNMMQYKKSNTTVSGAWARDKWASCVIVGLFLAFTIVKLKGRNKSLTVNKVNASSKEKNLRGDWTAIFQLKILVT